jgi:HSP20 family molecular chaperone IbpA
MYLRGESILSAKWRRKRTNSKRFDILKVFNRVRNDNPARRFRMKNSSFKQANSYKCRPQRGFAEKLREPKHLVDVIEGTDEITVVADFAGFNREDLRVRVKGEKLTVVAEALDHKYRKSLNLPKRVIPNAIRTTYKNGVLEIRLKKAEEKSIHRIAG